MSGVRCRLFVGFSGRLQRTTCASAAVKINKKKATTAVKRVSSGRPITGVARFSCASTRSCVAAAVSKTSGVLM